MRRLEILAASSPRIKFRQWFRPAPFLVRRATLSPPRAVRFALAGLAPFGGAAMPYALATPLEYATADMAQEQLLQRIAQTPHRRRERQPLDRHDVLHDVAAWPFIRLHAPELHDLRPAARAIGDGAEKLVHLDAVAGFLDGFA